MKFVCLTCGKSEIVIADKSPECLNCQTRMLPEREEGYEGLIFSPTFMIDRFQGVIAHHGRNRASTGRFKKEREAWICAVWALGVRTIMQNGIDYWIELVTKDQTPDCIVQYLDNSKGWNHRMMLSVEVVEWEEHRNDVFELIEGKCSKAYPHYYYLVLLARNGNPIEDYSHLLQRVQRLERVPFTEMWMFGRETSATNVYKMCRIHPNNFVAQFDLGQALAIDRGRDIHICEPGGRGVSTQFSSKGTVYLPIPE